MSSKAFVTGATSGIGLAIATRFADGGWDLVLTARREAELRKIADGLATQHGVGVTPLAFDVRDLHAIRKLQDAQPTAFRDVDVLVNNAGLALGTETLQEGKPEDWDVVIDTNVKGVLYVTRAILPDMLRRGRGHVINLGSTAGHWVYRGGAVYNATKFAVRAINDALRLDVHGTGIRVSSIDPGLVETNFSKVRFKGDAERAKQVYANTTPLTPDDIADVAWWVATRPPRVNIQTVIVMPTDQASIRDVHRRA